MFLPGLVVMLSPSITPVANHSLVAAYLGFANIMACHVFRGVALGRIHSEDEFGLSSTRIAAAFGMTPLSPDPL